MSTSMQPRLLTAEEFFQLPDPQDGSQQELVRGEIISMPPPGGMHGVTCSKVVRKIGAFVDAAAGGTVACNDTGFITERGPDSVRGPDAHNLSHGQRGTAAARVGHRHRRRSAAGLTCRVSDLLPSVHQ